jgi:hypothetical protein
MTWLINEDRAIAQQLSGIRVSDGNNSSREVVVRYINPEDELVKYEPPMILISMPNISIAHEREHRGTIQLPYAPEGYPNWWPDSADSYDPDASPYQADFPIPYNIDYQITVLGRIARQHMYPIMAELEQPTRLGRVATLVIPEDGTFRRITRMGGPVRQFYSYKDGPIQKKLFTATYMIRVPTEVIGEITDIRTGVPLASSVTLDVAYANAITTADLSDYYNGGDVLPGPEVHKSSVLGIRQDISWNTQSRD